LGAAGAGAGVEVCATAGPTMPTAKTVAATKDITELAFIESSSLFVEC
jgi:hypothetical protein